MRTDAKVKVEYLISISGKPYFSVFRCKNLEPVIEDILDRFGTAVYERITIAKHTVEDFPIDDIVPPPSGEDELDE